jgi:nucleoside-diphosphate-sugar epimerase
MTALFGGRVSQFVFTSSVAVYRRAYVQPVTELFRTHAVDDADRRKAYGVGKVRCESLLFASGLPATSLRVTHTIGPNSPLGSREPSFFARLEMGRPVLIPGEGFPFVHLVHVADVARLMVAVAGNTATIGRTYNVAGAEITSVRGCIELMARAVGVRPSIVSVPLDMARTLNPPLVHWGESLLGGTVYSISAATRDLEWQPAFGLEEAYRDSYAWFASGGRDRYTFDFSGDDAVLSRLR